MIEVLFALALAIADAAPMPWSPYATIPMDGSCVVIRDPAARGDIIARYSDSDEISDLWQLPETPQPYDGGQICCGKLVEPLKDHSRSFWRPCDSQGEPTS